MYFSDKIALWERAWSVEQRDIVTLVDETTAGLLNEDLRKEMRRSHARSEADYDRDLRFAINSIRKQLIAGELPHNDGEGLELQSSRHIGIQWSPVESDQWGARMPVVA